MNREGTGTVQPLAAETKVSLYNLVSKLITSLQPLAVRRNNILLNDIPKDFSVSADQNTLAYVLSQLANNAVSSTENQCIYIQAVRQDDNSVLTFSHGQSSPYLYAALRL